MKHLTLLMVVGFALAITGCATQKAQPVASADSGIYVIHAGDTFAMIAKAHHLTLKQLHEFNPTADPTRLKIGQKLNLTAPVGG